jgi:tetratricopeptide (TPR) repeat protein
LDEDAARRVNSVVGATSDEQDGAVSHESEDGAQRQFLLFDALCQFFKAAAEPRSIVIVFEDIHWADRQSLQLLEFIGAQIESSNLLIIVTARDWQDGESAGTLKELSRHPGFIRHDVARFSHTETRDLVLAFGTKNRERIDEIFRLSEGNAFFAVELTRLVKPEKGRSSTPSGTFQLPETVTETITRRIASLSANCTEILTVAAVFGRQFNLEELAAVGQDQDTAELRVFIEEAVTANVVREGEPLNVSFEFSHALIQKTIYDAIPSIQRQLIHGNIAEYFVSNLEAGRNSSSPRPPSEIAHHYINSADPSKRDEIAHYSILAGDEAHAAYAFLDAARHFTVAVGSTDQTKSTAALGELYLKQGLSHRWAGQGHEAIDSFIDAFDVFEHIGATAKAIEVSRQPIGRGLGVAPHQVGLCERGLALVEEGSLDQARILNEMGAALGSNQRQEEALDALEKSAAIATALEEPVLAAHALLNAAFTHIWALDIRKGAEASTTALRRLEDTEEELLVNLGHRAAGMAFLILGEPEESRYHSGELIKYSLLARQKGRPRVGFDEYMACVLALREGRWTDAMAIGDRRSAIEISQILNSSGIFRPAILRNCLPMIPTPHCRTWWQRLKASS